MKNSLLLPHGFQKIGWALLIPCLLLGGYLVFNGLAFIDVMVYNLFTLPLLFAAIYRWQLWRMRKEARDEE